MSVLILGDQEKAAIERAIALAREQPVPWGLFSTIAVNTPTNTLDLAERRGDVAGLRRRYPSQVVMLGTYRANFSYELQPLGLFRHLSVSSANKGKVPGKEVMDMVAEAFGFSGFPPKGRPSRVWMEEFEPGWHSVNVIEAEEGFQA